MTGMFVQLGCTYDMHRAHVVRGVLETHGVPAEVWHESPLIGDFVPGWLGCAVVVPIEEYESAVEILNARPGDIPEQDGAGEITGPLRRYPTFLDWAVTAAAVLLLAGIAQVVGTILEGPRFGGYHAGGIGAVGAMLYLVVVVPVGGVAAAALLKLYMVPLVIWNGSRWMGLLAYLWVRWFLFMVVPVAIGFAFESLRFAHR